MKSPGTIKLAVFLLAVFCLAQAVTSKPASTSSGSHCACGYAVQCPTAVGQDYYADPKSQGLIPLSIHQGAKN